MRFFWLWCAVLLAACGTRNQAVVAPCINQPPTGILGACPPCQVDSDCQLLSNLCEMQAYCVHKASSYKPSTLTCTENEMWLPPKHECKCLANVCDFHL